MSVARLYRFVEYKNTLEKYFYTTITSVTIYATVNLYFLLNEYFEKNKTKNTFLVFFFGGQVFYVKKTQMFFSNCITIYISQKLTEKNILFIAITKHSEYR